MEKLSRKEAELLAAARREVAARNPGTPATRTGAVPRRPAPAAAPEGKPKPSPAERLAQLMAEERAESQRRKQKMRRYGIIIPAATIALFALWALRTPSRKR